MGQSNSIVSQRRNARKEETEFSQRLCVFARNYFVITTFPSPTNPPDSFNTL
jgi:hypothetical protein